jgi:serine phosphatase RsbU (regulator of sigma subunit)/anti-sigma regulatory factor (Ser/Thr protein kinase)
LIVLSWSVRMAPPSADEQAVAARFAGQAALALAEAERREARRAADRLHSQLERSLLPTMEVADPRVRVAAFYRAGDERLSLGGDFYDCVERPDGSIAMIIGDVSGHGPSAAALGASMRSAWRALALAGGGPVEQLDGLESVLVRERQSPEMFVTALAGVVAADRASLVVSAAGHPPPLLLGARTDGSEHAGAPPLGVVSGGARALGRVGLGSPASIVLYTDGLIEGRAGFEAAERFGVERVEALLDGVDPGAVDETALARLVDAATLAHGTGLPDDVALLAVNLAPTGWARTWPAEIESIPELRGEVERFARGEGLDEEAVHAVKLAVAEVASNAVVHGFVGRALPGRLMIQAHRSRDTLYVTVADDGTGLRPRSDSPGLGLGLAMIAQLADGVDIDTPASGGTVVRLRFRVSPGGSPRR